MDGQLVQLGWVRLARHGDRITLEYAEDARARPGALLLRAGIHATPTATPAAPASGSVPAELADLSPLDDADLVDCVVMRRVDSGEATARLSRPRWWRVGRVRDQAAIRTVLRDDDQLFAWSRIVWARPATLRSAKLRRARPLIFDREAVDRPPERLAFAAGDALTRWFRA